MQILVKTLRSILGLVVIIIGCFFMSITVEQELFETICYKIVGFLILIVGAFYLKRIAKFGKQ